MSQTPRSRGDAQTVLVLPAIGVVGPHMVLQLLEQGFRVRGTVRSLKEEYKFEYLTQFLKDKPQYKDKVQLVEADPLKEEGWDEIIEGCDYVLHADLPEIPENFKDPNIEQQTLDATLNVLRHIPNHNVIRVVYNSNMFAVFGGNPITDTTFFDEEMWGNTNKACNYGKAKIKAEQTAWDFAQKHNIDMCVILTPPVNGPILSDDTLDQVDVFMNIFSGELKGVPKMMKGAVDVRDVATAFIRAMQYEEAGGSRYICAAPAIWMKEMVLLLEKEFQPYGYKKFPKTELGATGAKLLSLVIKKLKFFLPFLGKQINVSNEKIRKDLGMEFRSTPESVVESVHTLIKLGKIENKITKVAV